jgi:hypothetical protein
MSKTTECNCPKCNATFEVEIDDGFDMISRNTSEKELAKILEDI